MFWSTQTLKEKCKELIEPFREDRIKHGSYELSVGTPAYVSSDGKRSKVEPDSPITIPPGQFGLVITREVVRVPKNAIAFISIRAGTKFRGLVNVSGFHADPGYNDRLMFSVYNAGSQSIVLDYDQPVFMIWYADLDHEDEKPYKERTGEARGISADDIMKIQGEVASPAELKKLFDELRNELDKKFHEIELARQFNRP
jgi:dCTP deaminase